MVSYLWICRSWGGKDGGADAQPRERVDDADEREDGKRVLRPEDAAGVEGDEHQQPELEAAGQGVRDGQALEGEGRAEPAGDEAGVWRGRRGQGPGRPGRQDRDDPERGGQPERGRQVEPGSLQPMRQLDGPRRRIEIDAEHQRDRAGDRRRADADDRGGESLRRLAVAVEGVGRHGGERLRHGLGACGVAVIDEDDRRQPGGGAENADQRGQRHDGADGGVGPAGDEPRRSVALEAGRGERRQHPGGRGDGRGVEHAGDRLGDHGQAGHRGGAGDRAGVESPAQRRDHDRQRREIGEQHRQRTGFRADRKQEGRRASCAKGDGVSLYHGAVPRGLRLGAGRTRLQRPPRSARNPNAAVRLAGVRQRMT